MADFAQGYFYTPEDQTQIDALTRQRKLALALQQQGLQDPGDAPYGGLASAGKSLAGALLGTGLDQKERDISRSAQDKYTRDLGAVLTGLTPPQATAPTAPSPQISNASGSGPQMTAASPAGGMPSQAPAMPPAGGPSQVQAPAIGQPQAQPQAQPQQPYNPMAALAATHNPYLMQQFGPKLFEHQMDVNDRKVTPLSDQEAMTLGLRPGGVYGREAATGNVTVIQPSDMKSSGAVQQGYDIAQNTPLTNEQQQSLNFQGQQLGESHRHNVVEEQISQNPFGTGMGVTGAAGKTGDAFLATLPPGVAAQLKAVGTYRQPAPAGRASPTGIKFMTLVNQAYPDYDASQYGAKTKARNDFTTGKNGNTVRSLNVAVQHLDQLGQLSEAMGNGNVQMVNKIGNIFATQTGSPAPTNFNAAKQLVGDEIVKAIVGSGGGVSDREEAAHNISAASSPQQLAGVIKTYQGLLSGQLVGLRQQYQKSTGLNDFEDFLAPETRAKLESHSAPAPVKSRFTIEQVH